MYRLSGGGNKKQWTVLKHNGPSLYANYLGTDYMKNNRFNKNFLEDFKQFLPNNITLKSMDDIDISDIKNYIDRKKEEKRNMSKEEKTMLKERQDRIEEPYKYCIIDGAQQKVGNYKIEPPGIFLGRGEHPKLGKIKQRILPEDITINIDKTSSIPKPNVSGNWKKVIHDNKVIWLATWVDTISNKNKYVFTSMESIFKSKSDESKFDLAKQLKRKVTSMRKEYLIDMTSQSRTMNQLATALYFIDNLALRVGGKKNTKEKADTVGVTSLRVEHLTLLPNNTIKLDFLGKDSIRFCKKVKVSDMVMRNLEKFMEGKNKKDQLFDRISSASLNTYLEHFMKGLTAKVWRTYNASYLFQKELDKAKEDTIAKIHESERIHYLITFFNQANTAVALLCNHQKNVSGDITKQLEIINEKIKTLRKKKNKYKDASATKYKDMIKKIDAKINTCKLKKETKDKMKNVSLGTSKNNYIDPRIIFAFIKKFNIPEEKLFNKALLKRFEWARNVSKDYRF